MKKNYLTLFIEINNSHISFLVGENSNFENTNLKLNIDVPIEGFDKNKIFDFKKVFNILKENIFLIEQKVNFTFREIILILDNCNPLFINISGFKKINGSKILKENITYILNSIKSYVNEVEAKKTILHIFNLNFRLLIRKYIIYLLDCLAISIVTNYLSH